MHHCIVSSTLPAAWTWRGMMPMAEARARECGDERSARPRRSRVVVYSTCCGCRWRTRATDLDGERRPPQAPLVERANKSPAGADLIPRSEGTALLSWRRKGTGWAGWFGWVGEGEGREE